MNKTTNVSSYRSVAKSNALFGSVQIFNIIIGIVRSKIVAVLLGPSGMGVMGLLNSTIDLIKSVSNMGLQTSAVRDVTLAYESNDKEKIVSINGTLSRMVWVTGLVGALLMFILAPQLSEFSFSSAQYAFHIRILSVVILLSQLTIGRNVLLQGMRKLKSLASSNVIGGLIGLLVTIPLYYLYGEDGIVPAIIVNAIILYAIAWYLVHRLKIGHSSISWTDAFSQGKSMMKMGFLINLTGLMDTSIAYVINNLVQSWGTVAEVGFYTAGFALVQSYVGLVFNAIGTDFYPRLIAASSNRKLCMRTINQQFELMILVLLPLILLFIMCSEFILYILYSSEFMDIHLMISWLALGMIFRAYCWCPGFMYLAKNDSKLYFVIYIVTMIFQLLFYLGLYYYIGLTGIGMAFLLMYVLSGIATIIIVKWKYGIYYSLACNRLLLIATLIGGVTLGLCYWEHWLRYVLQALFLVGSSVYCLMQLNRRLDLSSFLGKLKKRL